MNIEMAVLVDGETIEVTRQVLNAGYMGDRSMFEFELRETFEQLRRKAVNLEFPPPDGS